MKILRIMRRWPDQESAIAHLERVRWNGRVVCPYCESEKTCAHASKDKKLPRWQCQKCHRAFSATVGTIFHHTHIPLPTWFMALAIMLDRDVNTSNAQLSRDLDLPYKTAWSLAMRIRDAMSTDPDQKRLFEGIVEGGGEGGESGQGRAPDAKGKRPAARRRIVIRRRASAMLVELIEGPHRNTAPRRTV